MLSLALNPISRVVALIAALFLWTTYQRYDARHDEKVRLTAEYERITSAEIARQAVASSAAIKAANARAVSAEIRFKELQEIANGIKSEAPNSGNACRLSPSVRERLLRIN